MACNLRAVDGDHPDANQAGLGAEREHLAEQLGQRALVALTEARDRRVIRALVGADHPRGDILDAAPLDPPRRALPERVAVEQQRDHHRRIVRRAALTVVAIDRVERAQIERRDGVDHEPRQMPIGQPLAQARRQQQLLIAITREEVLRHPEMVLTTPDGADLCATATMEGRSPLCSAPDLRSQAKATASVALVRGLAEPDQPPDPSNPGVSWPLPDVLGRPDRRPYAGASGAAGGVDARRWRIVSSNPAMSAASTPPPSATIQTFEPSLAGVAALAGSKT